MKQSLLSNRIIVTGGPTREYLDPVRFISNPSSGKMGASIAHAAGKCFKDIIFIHGPVDENIVSKLTCKKIKIETNHQMFQKIKENLVEDCIIIMSAAPTDFKLKNKSDIKIKKKKNGLNLKLIPNIDILMEINKFIKTRFKNIFICGFAAETNDMIENAKIKLKKKNMDMVCLNEVNSKDTAFGSDFNEIIIIDKNGKINKIKKNKKSKVALKIIEMIINSIEG